MDTSEFCTPSSKFHDLLEKLWVEHEFQIDALHTAISELRTQVGVERTKHYEIVLEGSLALLQSREPIPSVSTEFKPESEDKQNNAGKACPTEQNPKADHAELSNTKETLFTGQASKSVFEEKSNIEKTDVPTAEVAKIMSASKSSKSSTYKPFSLRSSYTEAPVSSGVWGMEFDPIFTKSTKSTHKTNNSSFDRLSSGLVNLAFGQSPMHPNSNLRTLWDYISIVLVGYDVISIPLMLAFEPEETQFELLVAWTTLIFWTLDMFVSTCTPYYQEGRLESDLKVIAKKYLKGWFAIDCVVVVPDWYLKFFSKSSKLGSLGRALKIVRCLRLLRLLKLQKLFGRIFDIIDSEYSFIVFGAVRMLLMIVVLNHFVACAWFGLGALTKAGSYDKNWLDNVGLTPVYGTDLAWQYSTSLHWAITQFTPASMDVYATNLPERIFSIFVLFWALLAVSSIIGNITATMTALRNMGNEPMKQMWMLRRFFRQKGISSQLQKRAVTYLEWVQTNNRNVVRAESVTLLKQISPALMMELSAEMGAPAIQPHPLFEYLLDESVGLRPMSIRICYRGLSLTSYGEGDSPFESEQEALAMYFIKSGDFTYDVDHVMHSKRCRESWVSEAVLWTAWQHRGTLTAHLPGDLCCVSPATCAEILRLHPRTYHLSANYGKKFVAFLNRNLAELTDVIDDCDVFCDVKECDTWRRSSRYENSAELARAREQHDSSSFAAGCSRVSL